MRLLSLAILLTLGGLPQQPPAAPVQTFRSGAQIVEVDVRVLGKDGQFVTDLAVPDFEITEDGVPQKVHSVALIGGDEDRRRAIANFQKYLQLGGPYVRQAQEGLSALGWK